VSLRPRRPCGPLVRCSSRNRSRRFREHRRTRPSGGRRRNQRNRRPVEVPMFPVSLRGGPTSGPHSCSSCNRFRYPGRCYPTRNAGLWPRNQPRWPDCWTPRGASQPFGPESSRLSGSEQKAKPNTRSPGCPFHCALHCPYNSKDEATTGILATGGNSLAFKPEIPLRAWLPFIEVLFIENLRIPGRLSCQTT